MGGIDIIQFLGAIFAVVKILCLVGGVIAILMGVKEGDDKKKINEIIFGVCVLVIGVLVPVVISKVAGSKSTKLTAILCEWDPSYFTELAQGL